MALPPGRKKKDLARVIAEREAQELAQQEEQRRRREAEASKSDKERAAESLAEKMRQQKLVEDADLAVARDLFGAPAWRGGWGRRSRRALTARPGGAHAGMPLPAATRWTPCRP